MRVYCAPAARTRAAGNDELLLVTGVRKQPYYSSEFRQVARLRRLHPEPLAEMSAATAASRPYRRFSTPC